MDEATVEVERKTNEARNKSKKVSFQEKQDVQRQDNDDVDMEEPANAQEKLDKDPWKKPQPQKKTQASQKVEMVYVRKNQDAREEEKTEDTKQSADSYLYQDVEFTEELPPPVGTPI